MSRSLHTGSLGRRLALKNENTWSRYLRQRQTLYGIAAVRCASTEVYDITLHTHEITSLLKEAFGWHFMICNFFWLEFIIGLPLTGLFSIFPPNFSQSIGDG